MEKTRTVCTKRENIAKAIMLLLIIVFAVSFFGATYCWTDQLNHKTTAAASRLNAVLTKCERDANGAPTRTVIQGAEFYLYMEKAGGDVQIGGRFVTNSKGEINPPYLEPGKYYFVETFPSGNFTFDTKNGKPITKYPFTITDAGDNDIPVFVFAYNKRISSDLVVEKEVKNADGSALTDEQKSQEFTFRITFSDNGTYEYAIDGGMRQSLTSGGTIKLKHGQKAVFANLPTGISYTVIEDAPRAIRSVRENLPDDNESNEAEQTSAEQISPAEVTAQAETQAETQTDDESLAESDTAEGDIDDTPVPDVNRKSAKAPDLRAAGGYWSVQSDAHSGTITEDGAVARFTNIWNPGSSKKGAGKLIVKKAVKGEIPIGDKDKIFNFTLVADGKETKFTLKDGESKTFTLPIGASYEVTEDDYSAEGYVQSISNGFGTVSGQTITVVQVNKYTLRPMIEIAGKKTWDLKGGNVSLPGAITVCVKSGGKLIDSAIVTAAQGWQYKFNLPKYEADGKTKIKYEIEEVHIDGWTPSYNGYDIKNTYTPEKEKDKDTGNGGGKKVDKPDENNHQKRDGENGNATGKAPQTGDKMHVMLWVLLMLASGIMLVIISFTRLRNSRAKPVERE